MVDRSKRQDYRSDLAGIDTGKKQYEKEHRQLSERYDHGNKTSGSGTAGAEAATDIGGVAATEFTENTPEA
jgi:hypothetical protein